MDPKLGRYWVTFTGMLADDDAVPAHDDTNRRNFLQNLTRSLIEQPGLQAPGVLNYQAGTVVLVSVVRAPSEGSAVDQARIRFTEAIESAGGSSNLPDGEDGSWAVARLLQRATVHELTQAA